VGCYHTLSELVGLRLAPCQVSDSLGKLVIDSRGQLRLRLGFGGETAVRQSCELLVCPRSLDRNAMVTPSLELRSVAVLGMVCVAGREAHRSASRCQLEKRMFEVLRLAPSAGIVPCAELPVRWYSKARCANEIVLDKAEEAVCVVAMTQLASHNLEGPLEELKSDSLIDNRQLPTSLSDLRQEPNLLVASFLVL
jgi:hypothetical protein